MSFLSATGNIIEAVLTRKGRELLAKGDFEISKYGFCDDGINYNLYDESLGTDADADILALPVLEPSTNDAAIRNLLVTMDPGTQILTWLAVNPTEVAISQLAQAVSIYAKTMNKEGAPEEYDVIDVNNLSSFNLNINVSQTIVDTQTNVQFAYNYDNHNLTTDTVYTFKLKGRDTGIVSDQLSLTAASLFTT
jgi:hypothetical protein